MLSRPQRRQVLNVARSLLGIAYDDSHVDASWRDLERKPRALDCSTFVCRVALEALGLDLPPAAATLIDQLAMVDSPQPGDLVAYWRGGNPVEMLGGYDVVFHVALYVGNGHVIGACDVARAVVQRAIGYEEALGPRRWQFVGDRVEPSPYRRLERR